MRAVSYTHLDVYKRQGGQFALQSALLLNRSAKRRSYYSSALRPDGQIAPVGRCCLLYTSFLISMCYTQLFNLLCEKADDVYGGRLPVHVRCLIDECANIGQIPKLEKLVATIRSLSLIHIFTRL